MVKTNPQTPQKCLPVAKKIRFGIPGFHQTEPKLRYSVNSVRSTTVILNSNMQIFSQYTFNIY